MPKQIPPCSHRPPCPGCPRYGDSAPPPAPWGELCSLAQEAGLAPPTLHSGAPLGFRHRARLAVRGRTSSPKLGIFQLGTHRIADIPHCGIQHPLINRVAASLKQVIRNTGVRPYADRPHSGDLRYLQVAVERSSERVQVVLVGNDATPDALSNACQQLADELGDTLHSLWWNGNPERSNSILGPHWQLVTGPEALCERIGNADIYFPPGAFGQSHLPLFDEVVTRVASWVPDGSRVAEFYGGTGALSLGLASRCASLRINEQSPHSLRGLELGLQSLPNSVRERVKAAPGRAGERCDLLEQADVILLDPPRRGLDGELLGALCNPASATPRRIVYVSCGVDSFLSDARRLLASGTTKLVALECYLLIPYSEHIETVALFQDASAT